MRWALGPLLLAGCQQVLGLESPELADAADNNVPPDVTGRIRYRSLENDVSGHPVLLLEAFAPADVTMQVTQGATTTKIALASDGTFSFARVPGPYSLDVTTPARTITYQLSADTLDLIDHVYGRLGTLPTPPATVLKLSLQGQPPAGFEYLASSGIWSLSQLTSTTFDWSAAQFQGPAGLLQASHHDRLYYLAYSSMGTAYTITHAANIEAMLVGGQTTQVGFVVAPLAQTSCAHVVAEIEPELVRVEASVRPGYTAKYGQFSIRSTPAFVMGMGTPLVGDNPGVSIDKNVSYGDPFMMDRYAHMYTVVMRDVGSVPVSEGTQVLAPVGADCNVETRLSAGLVAMPTGFTFAGVPLTDGAKLSLPGTTAELSWTVTAGRADVFVVALFQLSQGSTPLAIRTYLTAEPHLTLDTSRFARGTSYVFDVNVFRGAPGATEGDFQTVEQTTAYANAYSPVFSIE